jgi:HK97 family phage portal protein
MNLSAVWAAVNLISSDVASVPLKLYRREKGGKSPMENHPVYRLIHDQPNPQMSAFVFRRCLQAHKLVWGNGYAEIERDASGRPANLWPLLPYAVEPYLERGILRYRHWNPDGSTIEFPAADIVHIRGYTLDGICAASQIAKARESLGLTVAAERFGATFFGNGATFGGVISYPPGIGNNAQTRKENREAIEKAHQGPDRAHRFLALYEGREVRTARHPAR